MRRKEHFAYEAIFVDLLRTRNVGSFGFRSEHKICYGTPPPHENKTGAFDHGRVCCKLVSDQFTSKIRLSCHRFRPTRCGWRLSLLDIQSGQFVAATGTATTNRFRAG